VIKRPDILPKQSQVDQQAGDTIEKRVDKERAANIVLVVFMLGTGAYFLRSGPALLGSLRTGGCEKYAFKFLIAGMPEIGIGGK
jgi:hypothetical protein